MLLFRKTGEAFLIAGFSFLLFVVFFESRLQLPPWVQVVGRMHPLFLHFPIVLLLLFLASFWMPVNDDLARSLGLVAALTAIATAIMGLLLALEEGREGSTLLWHKWGGVAISLFSFLLYFLYSFLAKKKWVARPVTFVTAFILLATGHWGAGLTHGDDYLLAPLAENSKEKVPIDQALAFQHVVRPIFDQKCGSCHSTANRKGGLALDDTISVMHGGKTGPLYEAGQPEKSLLLKRILLPLDDKKHMAPKNKPQLTEEEVQLIFAWIKAGAPLNQKIITLPLQDSFRMLAANTLSPAASNGDVAYAFPAADEKLIKQLNNNYRVVTPVSLGSPALSVRFYGRQGYSAKALAELLSVKEQIIDLSLARLPVKDEDMKTLQQLTNLQRLNLNYTDVTPAGLQQLVALKKLTELALSGTGISAAVAAELAKLPSLKALYVWNTPLDSSAVSQLKKDHNDLRIDAGYKDNGQIMFPLTPPVAKTISGIYDRLTPIELKHPYRGVEIRYTTDETEPDSVKSPVYTKPLLLEKFTVIKAKAFKQGWYGSQPMKAVYFTTGVKPDSLAFGSREESLKGKEALLVNKEIGDMNVGSGAWVEIKKPTVVQFFFNKPVSLQQLALNTFVRTEWDIFPVAKMEVWGGTEKEKLKKLNTWQQAVPTKMEEPDLKQPIVTFPPGVFNQVKLIIYPLASMPAWRPNKGKPSRVFISEVLFN